MLHETNGGRVPAHRPGVFTRTHPDEQRGAQGEDHSKRCEVQRYGSFFLFFFALFFILITFYVLCPLSNSSQSALFPRLFFFLCSKISVQYFYLVLPRVSCSTFYVLQDYCLSHSFTWSSTVSPILISAVFLASHPKL